jgi:fructokinase
VGKDEPGDTLIQLLQTVGVDISGIQRHPIAPTRQIYVVRTQSGDRIFAGFADYDTAEFADTHLQASLLPVSLFENADFLVLGTLELAYPQSGASVRRALELADQYNVKIVLDVNWRPVFWHDPNKAVATILEIVPQVDFLKLSKEEALLLFQTADPGAIAYRLNTAEGVIVTDGENGCVYCLSENEGKVPSFSVPAIETTGAGDSFVAGFVHQLCKLGIHSLSDAEVAKQVITYASAAGALTTTKPGAIAAQPTAAEVEAFLEGARG